MQQPVGAVAQQVQRRALAVGELERWGRRRGAAGVDGLGGVAQPGFQPRACRMAQAQVERKPATKCISEEKILGLCK